MKKTLGLIGIFICCGANATTMCMHSNSYVATLLRGRDGVSITTGQNGAWTTTFDYYTSSLNTMNVTGFAACNELTGTANTADGTVSTSVADTGQNCWCSMKTPLVSDWVYSGAYASDSDCASSCQTACATNVKTSTAFRTAMFEAVW
ncbi:MAG: hypothetical protein J6T57_01220 [Alphaproteobacteria bacterium]|nr:hypothetical protein [Alphaproteobacteria bacterium]